MSGGQARRTVPRLGRWLPLVVLAAGLAVFFILDLDRYVSFESLQEHREVLLREVDRLGLLAGLLFTLAYAVTIAVSIPGAAVLTMTGGFLFGALLGGTYAVIGATLGATALFLAARTALRPLLQEKAGRYVERMGRGFRDDGFNYLLVLRLVPVFPFWLVNLVPALIGVPLRTYVLATFIGIIPGTFVYASVGNGLGAVFEAGERPDLGLVFKPEILLPLIGLAVLALIPPLYKRLRRT